MEIQLNENIKIWQKYSMEELLSTPYYEIDDEELFLSTAYREPPTKIYIRGREFNVIPYYRAVRTKSSDGYYRFIYIQINTVTGEYYIGKVNRQRLSEFKKYQGSGVKFKNKYNKHSEDYARYYLAACETARETEQLEAEIVNEELLKDPFCQNLVKGGGGINKNNSSEEKKQKQREYMKSHPERYKAMIEAHKKLYNSGDSAELRRRSMKIKDTMSSEKYRQMTRERIKRWREEKPEEYELAREKNRRSIQNEESKQKRNKSLAAWRQENPELYALYKEKLKKAQHSEEAEAKRRASLKRYHAEHPEAAKKRSKASVAKSSKPVNMLDLETNEVIRTFPSQHAAAEWLAQNGYAKNTNCVASVNAVCLKKKCTTGYGYRKKAYGFGWEYAEKRNNSQ